MSRELAEGQTIAEALCRQGTVMCVVGARPNFMTMAPILRVLTAHEPPMSALLAHAGQHYDQGLSHQLFDDLGLPLPNLNLEVGSGSHAAQTAEVVRRFEPVIDNHRPVCNLVVGDFNPALVCTLVAVKKGVPVVHVAAGLRSYGRKMPDEINRVLTDQVADRPHTTECSALDNLRCGGVSADRVCVSGNLMIDSLVSNRPRARAVADTLPSLLGLLGAVAASLPPVFALHPRTRSNIERFGLAGLIDPQRMALLPPQRCLEMLGLMPDAMLVLTDSGGPLAETAALWC